MTTDWNDDPFEDWLDSQTEGSLTGMLETLAEQECEARLKARLVRRAIERRAGADQPARPGGAPARGRGGGGRFTGVSRETLVATVREAGRPVTPDELCEILVERGHTASPDSMRTALSRAVRRGELRKLGDRSYVAVGDGPGPAEREARKGKAQGPDKASVSSGTQGDPCR